MIFKLLVPMQYYNVVTVTLILHVHEKTSKEEHLNKFADTFSTAQTAQSAPKITKNKIRLSFYSTWGI